MGRFQKCGFSSSIPQAGHFRARMSCIQAQNRTRSGRSSLMAWPFGTEDLFGRIFTFSSARQSTFRLRALRRNIDPEKRHMARIDPWAPRESTARSARCSATHREARHVQMCLHCASRSERWHGAMWSYSVETSQS